MESNLENSLACSRCDRVLIVYDTKRGNSATRAIAECIADILKKEGLEAIVCRASEQCPSLEVFDLIVLGSPIYYERPMKSVTEFIDRNKGLAGFKVAVYITCFVASREVPSPIRNFVIRKYLGSILKHVRGEVVASKAFKGWWRSRDEHVLEECIEWCRELVRVVTSNR